MTDTTISRARLDIIEAQKTLNAVLESLVPYRTLAADRRSIRLAAKALADVADHLADPRHDDPPGPADLTN